MTTTDNIRFYADEGNFIIRKEDGFIMGENICLGDADSITNYEEEPYTEESYAKFYTDLGLPVPEKKKEKTNEE